MATVGLKHRLAFEAGAVHDGPRRYLLMRPDVLMGTVQRLSPDARVEWLQAARDAACAQGMGSLQAYAQQVGGDAQALLQATAAAAADLGWGQWAFELEPGRLTLQVQSSPFAAGWLAVAEPVQWPVCAPVAGMLQAVASLVLGEGARVQEHACAAQGHVCCRLVAQYLP